MRRVGTLTSASTLLALGLVLGFDIWLDRDWFGNALLFWPLVVMGLGVEVLAAWMSSRRKGTQERIRPDGRSLALLMLVGVFSINFYLTSVRAAQGEAEPVVKQPLFAATTQEVKLLRQAAVPRSGTKKIAVHNGIGTIIVKGTSEAELSVEATAKIETGSEGYEAALLASAFTPQIEWGETMKVTVPEEGMEKLLNPVVDLTIQLPKGIELQVQSEHGDITLSEVHGNVFVWTRGGVTRVNDLIGSLRVDNLGGAIHVRDVLGSVQLSAVAGGVTASGIVGDAVVKSQAGKVQIAGVTGQVDLVGGSGDADVADVDGAVKVQIGEGPLKLANPGAGVAVSVKTGDIDASGSVRGPWTITTENGKVQLAIPPDSAVKFLGETSKGVIKGPTKQSPSGGTKQGFLLTEQMGDGTYPVTVRTYNGSVVVDVK